MTADSAEDQSIRGLSLKPVLAISASFIFVAFVFSMARDSALMTMYSTKDYLIGVDTVVATSNSVEAATQRAQGLSPVKKNEYPREMTPTFDGEYNFIHPDKRYLIFQPSGGFNNQRVILMRALRMSRYLGRVIVVPMLAKHVNMWLPNYNLKAHDGMMPMDRILDFPFMAEVGFEALPLNVTLKEFVTSVLPQKFGKDDIFDASQTPKERAKHPIKYQRIKTFKSLSHKFLYLGKGAMWQYMWRDTRKLPKGNEFEEGESKSWKGIRYSPYLQGLARRLSDQLGEYNAMHIRMGDYKKRQRHVGKTFLEQALKNNFGKTSNKLYIATEPVKDFSNFKPLMNKFNVSFSSNFDTSLLAEFDANFENGLPGWHQLRNDVLGNVEQLICAMSANFIGSRFSTFSLFISRMRLTQRYPLLVPAGIDKGPLESRNASKERTDIQDKDKRWNKESVWRRLTQAFVEEEEVVKLTGRRLSAADLSLHVEDGLAQDPLRGFEVLAWN